MLKGTVKVTCGDCGRVITTAGKPPKKCGACLRTNLTIEPLLETRPAEVETRGVGYGGELNDPSPKKGSPKARSQAKRK